MTYYDETLDGNLDMEEQKIYIMKRSGERVILWTTTEQANA